MADTDSALARCPFCSAQPEFGESAISGDFWIRCEDCFVETCHEDEAVARAAWNRRTPPAPAAPVDGERERLARSAKKVAAEIRHVRDGALLIGWEKTIHLAARLLDELAKDSFLRLPREREGWRPKADLAAQFAAMAPSAPLPWNAHAKKHWLIVDANGKEVCFCGHGSNDQRLSILGMILVAVNTCGGFRAEIAAVPSSPSKETTADADPSV